MSLKFIGISQRLVENQSYYELREALSVEWGEFFAKNLQGYLPLPLSYAIPFEEYASALQNSLKGVILSGGNDLNSVNASVVSKMRDMYEREIIQHCLDSSLPLLGVCRGAQIIAEYFNSILEKIVHHTQPHKITLRDNSSVIVNSFHNYGIYKLGDLLECMAVAEDNSIEAFKHINGNIFGIMWHIERENGFIECEVLQRWMMCLGERECK